MPCDLRRCEPEADEDRQRDPGQARRLQEGSADRAIGPYDKRDRDALFRVFAIDAVATSALVNDMFEKVGRWQPWAKSAGPKTAERRAVKSGCWGICPGAMGAYPHSGCG